MTSLWTELYRPSTIDGYVFTDQNQKMQIESWIAEKSIPHLLFSGSAGLGKCLGPDEKLNVRFVDVSGTSEPTTVTIFQLFDQCSATEIEFEKPLDLNDIHVEIQTPTGWTKIHALVRKNTQTAKYHFENGEHLICATKHLVFQQGQCLPINQCTFVDTVTGPLLVSGSDFMGQRVVYDIAVDSPHQYITANGIIHHNTTLAKILIKALEVHPYDVLEINASRDNSVDNMRTKITNFVSTMPYGALKIVLLDESDFLTQSAQAIMRGLMEEYASVARFILTCNYAHKIIPALQSRCQGFHMEKLDQVEFTTRVAEILLSENIQFELDVLDTYVRSTFPDLRKCINSVQQNSKSGQLLLSSKTGSTADFKIDAVNLFKQGRIREARALICKQVRPEEIDDLISWAYNNLDLWSSTEEGQDQAVLIIRKAAVNASLVADAEINIAALFIELSTIEG